MKTLGRLEIMIPDFRSDGYLPEGLHRSAEGEVILRFGASSFARRRLGHRLQGWLELARQTRCRRFLVDGSFVTSKEYSNDIDAVVLLSNDFAQQIVDGASAAIELEQMLMSRRPEDLFAADDLNEWHEWVELFSQTREADGRRKGIVEVLL